MSSAEYVLPTFIFHSNSVIPCQCSRLEFVYNDTLHSADISLVSSIAISGDKMPFDVRGQIAIITGSAQGFGKEFAKRLLRQGAKVCVSDINEDIGSRTLQELQRTYGASNVTFKR